jgi:hypothetical protein
MERQAEAELELLPESATAYRCADCPPALARVRQHPVLGPVCANCHLVLCANE